MKLRQTVLAIGLALASGFAATQSHALESVTLGHDSQGLAVDAVLGRAYVTNSADGTLSVVKLPGTAPSRTFPVGAHPQSVLSDSAHQRVYIAYGTLDGHVGVFDAVNGAAIADIPVGASPAGMVADFRRGALYVVNRDSNSVSFIDTTKNAVVATVSVGRDPGSIDVDRLAGRIYVSSPTDDTVWILDQSARQPIAVVPVGIRPGSVAADERTGKVLVNNIDDGTVSIIDVRSNTVRKVLRVGTGSTAGAVSDVYRQYFLPNARDDTVSIVDIDADEIVATVDVETSPRDVVIDEVRGNIYVANQGSNSVSVIDLRTEKRTDSMSVGTAPWRIGLASGMLLALDHRPGTADAMTLTPQRPAVAETAIVTEFYDATRDVYFHTSDALETAAIRDGASGGNWQRTMEFFRVWTGPGAGRTAVCRLFNPATGTRDSHYFAADPWDCVRTYRTGKYVAEGTAYFVMFPNDAGQCPVATAPLFRLDRDMPGDARQQRLTSSAAVRDAMARWGWVAQGSGPATVYACTPTLRDE